MQADPTIEEFPSLENLALSPTPSPCNSPQLPVSTVQNSTVQYSTVQYSTVQYSCRWISLRGDTVARCGPGVTQWAQRVGWEVDLGRGWLAAQPACDCDIGIGSWADVWLN